MTSNIDGVIRKWQRRARVIRPFMQAATTEATRVVYAESKKQMTELIYNKPVPTRAREQERRRSKREGLGKTFTPRGKFTTSRGTANTTGRKKAWTRTGNLRREERMKIASAYIGIISNNATSKSKSGKRTGYARARHEMRNTRYPAPWRANAIDNQREAVKLIYREAFRRAIRGGILPGM